MKDKKIKIKILGTPYIVRYTTMKKVAKVMRAQKGDYAGYHAGYKHEIGVATDLKISVGNGREELIKKTLRHEIIHAFLFESGLGYDSCPSESWAANEEMVDFFAHQSHKIFKTFEKLGI